MAELHQILSESNAKCASRTLILDTQQHGNDLHGRNLRQLEEDKPDHRDESQESGWETDSASNPEHEYSEGRQSSHEDDAYFTPVEDGAESVEGDCQENGGRGFTDVHSQSSGVGVTQSDRNKMYAVATNSGETGLDQVVKPEGSAAGSMVAVENAEPSWETHRYLDAAASADDHESSRTQKEVDANYSRQQTAHTPDTASETRATKTDTSPAMVTIPNIRVASHVARSSSFRRNRTAKNASSLETSSDSDSFERWEERRRKSFDSLYSESSSSDDSGEVLQEPGSANGGVGVEGRDVGDGQSLKGEAHNAHGHGEYSTSLPLPYLKSGLRSSTKVVPEGVSRKKSVTFQLSDSSDSDDRESVRIYSPPPRMRLFPLRGGILRVQRSTAARALVLGERQVAAGLSSSSLASSLDSGDSPLERLANMSNTSLADQLAFERASELGLTTHGGAVAEDHAVIPQDRIDDISGTDGLRLKEGEVRLREVKVQYGQIRQVEERLNIVAVQPALRSTRDWGGRHGPKLNLREAFQQMALAREAEIDERKRCAAEGAMLDFEKAAAALKVRKEAEKGEARNRSSNSDEDRGLEEASRKDSQQSYISLIDSSSREGGPGRDHGDLVRRSLESTHSSQSSHSSDLSYITAPSNRLQSSQGSFGLAITTDGETSESLYSTPLATYGSTSSLSVQLPPRNFSRPLTRASLPGSSRTSTEDLREQRPGTPSPRVLSYAESSRIQYSRHNAWTIRQRVLLGKMQQEMAIALNDAKIPTEQALPPDPKSMRSYWRSQVVLLRGFDASHQRVPLRRARPPSPCSSCSTFIPPRSSTPARPQTPAFRRRLKKVLRVLRHFPSPRFWFKHKTRHPLVKYPRGLNRSLSRTDDWPSKNEEEVERTLHRKAHPGSEAETEATEAPPAAEYSSARFYGTSARHTKPGTRPRVSSRQEPEVAE